MAAEWHYSNGGQQHGPVSAADLKALAKSGNLLPTDLIWKEGMAEWKPASNVKGLFSTVESSKASPASPQVEALPVVPETAKKQTLVEAAKGAAQYAAKQTERTKLMNLTLPPLYQALGRHAFSSPDFRAEFAELFQQLDQVKAEQSEINGRTPAAAKSLGDKAKAMAGQAMQAAQSQKLSLRQSSLFGTLGKVVYDKHEAASGPQELVKPIADGVARLAMLDSDLETLSATKDGSWITPKRLAISIGAAACVLLLIFLMMARGGAASYTQRVLDLTAEQKKEFGVSVPKGARPLFAPGSAEDFMQSLTFFKYSGKLVSFDTTPTPNGRKEFGDTDGMNGIHNVYFVQYTGGMFVKKRCWEMIYGPQLSLKSVEEITPGERKFGGGRSILMDQWSVNCIDETLLVRGYSPKSPLAANAKKDEILLEFVHFDRPHKNIVPEKGQYMRKLDFKY